MALLKGVNIVTGLAVGIGAGLVAPIVTPIVKPFAKSVLKACLIAYDQARVAFAELNEGAGDVISEARAEIEEERKSALQGEQPASKGKS